MQSLFRKSKCQSFKPLSSILFRSGSDVRGQPINTGKVKRELLQEKPELVIFDKDGTLICFDSMWIPWMKNQVQKLEHAFGIPLEQKLYKWWGFDPKIGRFTDQSLLAHQNSIVIKDVMVTELKAEGFPKPVAEKLLSNCWDDCDPRNPEYLKPLTNIKSMFDILEKNGVKTAVCTSDNREGTVPTLQELGILQQVDKIVCGDDKEALPKPNPHNIWHICEELSVCPTKTVMIGDTTSDTEMGHSAGIGLTVGVLSGTGERHSLEEKADLILNNVGELLPVILPHENHDH